MDFLCSVLVIIGITLISGAEILSCVSEIKYWRMKAEALEESLAFYDDVSGV